MRQPVDQAQARGLSGEEVEQKDAIERPAAPSLLAVVPSGDGENDREDFCVRLSRNERIVIANSEFDGTNSTGGNPVDREATSGASGRPIRLEGGTGRGEEGREEGPAADAASTSAASAAAAAAAHAIALVLDRVSDCAEVLRGQNDQSDDGGKDGNEGEGELSKGSGGDTDSGSSDEESASSSEDDSTREVGTASGERENWELRETVEDGFTRVSTREEKRQAKREVQKEKEKNRVELAAKAREEERKDREIQRKLLAEASQRNPQTRARTARERQEAQAKEAEGRAQRPGAQKGRGGGGRLAGGGRGRGRGGEPGRGKGGTAGLIRGKYKVCPISWCGSLGQQRREHPWRGPDFMTDCSICGWKKGQDQG